MDVKRVESHDFFLFLCLSSFFFFFSYLFYLASMLYTYFSCITSIIIYPPVQPMHPVNHTLVILITSFCSDI